MSQHLLEVKNLYTRFYTDGSEIKAVNNVSYYLDPGEIIGVVGESGCGKSVTQKSIMQLIQSPGKITGGEVLFRGVDLLQYAYNSPEMRSYRGGKIGMIFQEPMTSLNPVLTIGYQIQESLMIHNGLDKKAAKEKTIEMLKMVNIPDAESRFNYYPNQFSGGMRQRIMIAMVLAVEPDLLIADEATTALDVTTQAQILDMLQDLVTRLNTAMIIVTHNLGIVARYAQRIYVMYAGHVVETGTCEEIFAKPEHPYTRSLLRAIPRLDDPKDRVLIPIDGLPPNLANKPDYCAFYERCVYRCDRCKELPQPEPEEITPGHYAACILTEEEKAQKEEELARTQQVEAPVKNIGNEIILDVKGVSKSFPVFKGVLKRKVGVVKAVEDLTFKVRRGECLGIVGESGCGKTTLARCILRVYKPESGSIELDGQDLVKMEGRTLYKNRAKISMVYQDPYSTMNPRQTAGDMVAEAIKIHQPQLSEKERNERVDRLFTIVGLPPAVKTRVPHEFSGGQRQRIGVAAALSANPSLIICDEPISALDVSIQAQIINLLEKLQAEMGLTYLFIAHDLAVVKHISDRVLVMYLGRIVEIADCEDLYENTLHPYTKALLSAIPVADPVVEKARDRVIVEGEVPSLMYRPSGCTFHDRCPHCTERCEKESPVLKDVGNGHEVACFLYE